jgi:hypothetical protein
VDVRVFGLLILAVAVVLGPRFLRISKSLKDSNNASVKPDQQPIKTILFRRIG